MEEVPNISQFTSDSILIAEAGTFLKELQTNTLIDELVPHTCDSVNAEPYGAFRVRISQTKNRSKLVLSFTRGNEAVCFMVKSSDRRNYDQAELVSAIMASAQKLDATVIDMTVSRSKAMTPVHISQNVHHRCHRLHRRPAPAKIRKPGYKALAAR